MSTIINFILLLALIGAAIMFDWFGARALVQTGLETTQQTVDKLNVAGDRVSEAFESIDDISKLKQED